MKTPFYNLCFIKTSNIYLSIFSSYNQCELYLETEQVQEDNPKNG